MKIYYVRHGDPIYNPDGLTDFGKQQAELLKEKFEIIKLNKIFASTSERAKMTAKPTADSLGLDITTFQWANEGEIGKDFWMNEDDISTWIFNHPKYKKIFVSKEIQNLGDKWYNHSAFSRCTIKNGILEMNNNVDEFLLSLGYRHDRENHCYVGIKPNNDKIGFFAHGGCGMAFVSSIIDIPYPIYSAHYSEHMTTGITCIDFSQVGDIYIPKIITFNETPHLFANGVNNQFGV